jgi:hypothetical protein
MLTLITKQHCIVLVTGFLTTGIALKSLCSVIFFFFTIATFLEASVRCLKIVNTILETFTMS